MSWQALITWNPILTLSVVSLICGFLVGVEREVSQKPAGIRTTILVVLGAAIFTHMSPILADINTTRIAANVVVGIGFIGAGTIIQSRGQVQGITTAATMWVCAAIGMMIGSAYYLDAGIITVFVVAVLNLIGRLERNQKIGKQSDE